MTRRSHSVAVGALLSLSFLLPVMTALAQCANNNTLIAGGAISPPCPGTTTVPCVQGGQYALVNVTAGNIYTFSTCSSTAFDSQITLYNNTGGASLGYNDDGCGLQSTVTWTAGFTGQLRVLVDRYNCANNAICIPLTIQCTPGPPPVTNNEPCGAINLAVANNCAYSTYTNVGATNSSTTPAPGCGNFTGASQDVWFTFVAPPTGIVTIQTQAGTMTDLAMALYADPPPPGCAGPFTLVQCDDDSGPGLMPFLSFTNLTPGWTYYLRTWGYGAATGTFNLCVFGPTTVPPGACTWALELFDSFGDGWGSSTVQVSINGVVTNYTVTGSYQVVLLGLNPGDLVIVTYNGTGPGQAENRFELSYSNGATIFNSGTPPATGSVFTQTVTCNPPPTPPQDCAGGITVCSGQSFGNNSNNTGNVVDLTAANQGCLASGERQGTWYYFSPSAGGTIGFTISPVAPTDYDFAVWGPMASITCPPPGPPLRCSYAAPFGDTGAGNGATDPTEGAGGDRWISTFNVLAGEIYIMYIDNFSTNGQAFNLSWQLTNGASLDCTILPVELTDFDAKAAGASVELNWITASERNSGVFEIERSIDGGHFERIGAMPAAGNSSRPLLYTMLDRSPSTGVNHYRLRQIDADGRSLLSPVKTVMMNAGQNVRLVPNPGSGLVDVLLPSIPPGSVLLMLDATGREVMRIALEMERVTFDAASLPGGLYGFRVLSDAGEPVAYGTWVRE